MENNDAYKVLTTSSYDLEEELTPIEANDEMITIFCNLHGGLEEAMPIIRNQFKKFNVDFSAPSKEGLRQISHGLAQVTKFLKGTELAQMQHKRFNYLVDAIA